VNTYWCGIFASFIASIVLRSVADPHHFDPDPDPIFHFDADLQPDPTYHLNADPDPEPFTLMRIRILPFTLMRIRIHILALNKGSKPEKVLKQAHVPHILA
jgi:hypothetical protein